MAFLLKAMGFGETIPGFAFTAAADAKAAVLDGALVPWTMKSGTSDEDKKPVTIFTLQLASCSSEVKALARNALTLSKRLRLPGVLRCYGGAEYADTIYVAMEPCEPLSAVLASPSRRVEYYGSGEEGSSGVDGHGGGGGGGASGARSVHAEALASPTQLLEEGVAMGLKAVGGALTTLHQSDLFHGNVCSDAVFVTDGGFWRLWGLELTTACGSASSYVNAAARLVAPCRVPTAMLDALRSVAAGARSAPSPTLLDSYGLGSLIYESLVLTKSTRPDSYSAARRDLQLDEVRRGRSQLPQSLQLSFSHLTAESLTSQYTVAQFMDNCDFVNESDYVASLAELEELALWDQAKRDTFMERLAREIPSFPRKACVTVFLGKLLDSVRMNIASASVVAPLLAIAQRVRDAAEFNTLITPALVTLYQSPDRLLRYRLLQQIDVYGKHIDSKPLCEQIWPHFVKGFTSPLANIREYTARALVPLAPRLSSHIMANDVPRLLQTLQHDPDGTLRANATICLCLVAEYIPEGNGQRAKTLVVGFGRMLKDQFVPSRLAALNSLRPTLDYVPARLMAEVVVPGVAPSTMDTEAEARQTALAILTKCFAKLQAHNEAAKRASPSAGGTAAATTSTVTGARPGCGATSSDHSTASSGVASRGADGVWGWSGWLGNTATPPPSSTDSPPAPSSPKHADPFIPIPAAAPAPTPVAAVARSTVVPAAKPTVTASAKASSGWSDDDGEDGWKPVPTVQAPVAPVRPMTLRTTAPAPTPLGTAAGAASSTLPVVSSGMPLSGDGVQRLRKKGGGLGASRMD